MTTLADPVVAYSRPTAFLNVLRSELLKIRSVPSTFWTLACAVVFNVVLAAVLAVLVPGRLSASDRRTTDAIQLCLGGIHLTNSGSDVFVAAKREAAGLGPWTGFGVFCLYAVVALAAGYLSITRRDA